MEGGRERKSEREMGNKHACTHSKIHLTSRKNVHTCTLLDSHQLDSTYIQSNKQLIWISCAGLMLQEESERVHNISPPTRAAPSINAWQRNAQHRKGEHIAEWQIGAIAERNAAANRTANLFVWIRAFEGWQQAVMDVDDVTAVSAEELAGEHLPSQQPAAMATAAAAQVDQRTCHCAHQCRTHTRTHLHPTEQNSAKQSHPSAI